MANVDKDVKKIEQLIDLMKENDLVEVEIAHGEDKICLKRQQAIVNAVPGMSVLGAAPMAPAQESPAAEESNDELPAITSPLVGTFYTAPSPDSDPFIAVGAHVDPSTVVCIIEAMKVMNEIKAETSGTIVEQLVDNGAAIEFGQPLFRVRPD
jgi:acetyl-CoA carboxylase biotin carboxyl carrier protein